jgi:hypothetical protein
MTLVPKPSDPEFVPPDSCDICPHPISQHVIDPPTTDGEDGYMFCGAPVCDYPCWHEFPHREIEAEEYRQRAHQQQAWAATDADLRYVLAHARMPAECEHQAIEFLDHNELGLAWETISNCLINPSPEVTERMEAARQRMGLQPA